MRNRHWKHCMKERQLHIWARTIKLSKDILPKGISFVKGSQTSSTDHLCMTVQTHFKGGEGI